jgi:hypothetical protein
MIKNPYDAITCPYENPAIWADCGVEVYGRMVKRKKPLPGPEAAFDAQV